MGLFDILSGSGTQGQQGPEEQTQAAPPAVPSAPQAAPAPAPQAPAPQAAPTAQAPSAPYDIMAQMLQDATARNADIGNNDVPQVRPEAFASALQHADLTNGIDFVRLDAAMRGAEDASPVMQEAFQSVARNTMFAMVPMLNQMAQALHNSTLTQAVSRAGQGRRAEDIVQTFNRTYTYGDNAVVAELLKALAPALATHTDSNASADKIAGKLHDLFAGLAAHITQPQTPPSQTNGVTTDFANLFS